MTHFFTLLLCWPVDCCSCFYQSMVFSPCYLHFWLSGLWYFYPFLMTVWWYGHHEPLGLSWCSLYQYSLLQYLFYDFVLLFYVTVHGRGDTVITKVVLGKAHSCTSVVLTLEINPKVVNCFLHEALSESFVCTGMLLNSILRCLDIITPGWKTYFLPLQTANLGCDKRRFLLRLFHTLCHWRGGKETPRL